MSKTQVVVLGRNYTSILGMVRAVGSLGYEVSVVRTVRRIPTKGLKTLIKDLLYGENLDQKSRYIKDYLYAIEPHREALIQLLLSHFASTKEKVILIPTDDFVASTIDLYQDQLKEKFYYPHINHQQGAVVSLMDKDVQKNLAIQAGLNVAKGWVIKIEQGSYSIPEDIEYPCFTKPEISFLGNKECMKRCDHETELRKVIDKVAKVSDCPILVEQYIEFDHEYGVLGFSDGKNVWIPGLVHKKEIGKGAHRGVTLLGEVSSLDENKELKEKLTRFIESTKFTGLFDIDLYEEKGKFYFNELNLRFGAFGYALMCANINLPKKYIDMHLGINHKEEVLVKKPILCLSDKVNLQDYDAGYISWKEYQSMIQKADYRFILSKEDPAPFKAYKKTEYVVRLKRFVKKLLKRN